MHSDHPRRHILRAPHKGGAPCVYHVTPVTGKHYVRGRCGGALPTGHAGPCLYSALTPLFGRGSGTHTKCHWTLDPKGMKRHGAMMPLFGAA